jgi:P-type Ca2+ transporter type 2C
MFENRSVESTLSELGTNTEKGLSANEVDVRRAKYGLNKLGEKKKESVFFIFLGQFKDPMTIVLFAAAIITIIVSAVENSGDYADVFIIFGVIILNAIIGTVQEAKAEKALEALKKMSSPTATVRRDGNDQEIKAEELVPGDIVVLEEGRTVPADLRLTKSVVLKADESSLTGESMPVEKDAKFLLTDLVGVGDRINEVYMSTPIVYGHGEGVVIATGMNTEIGRIAKMLSEDDDDETPLQKKLAQLSKFLGILTIVIVVIMFAVSLVYEAIDGTIGTQWSRALLNAVGLAVAAIPEGLPAVVTIVLALGMQKMVKVNTIVRKLASVETLGAVSVVCSDKTGTLTQNKMTVVAAYSDEKIFKKDAFDKEALTLLATGMTLCSDATIEKGVYGDPTEVALVRFASDLGYQKSQLEKDSPRIDELPFDSVRKMMSTKHQVGDKTVVYTKGALDKILKHTQYILIEGTIRPLTQIDIDKVMNASSLLAADALRVLALAYREGELKEDGLIFVGLVGMVDPPRAEAKPAVDVLKGAGITTVMITGDHRDTAFAIAKELRIADRPEQCMAGDEIDLCTPAQLQDKVKDIRVFARVSPENKVSIVKAFKANGHIVAMTGDGVNDAPSLRAADIGIAMGITGTDVAKGAADMVLTDDNFASIEKAVEEGRGIYANIKKTILFLISSNVGEVVAMFVAISLGLPAPLVAIHLLWVNLITDSLPAIALGADRKPADIMSDRPREAKESLFAHGGYAIVFGYGILIGAVTLIAFLIKPWQAGNFTIDQLKDYFEIKNSAGVFQNLEEAQSMAFCVLSFSELFHMLGMTDVRHSFVRVFKDKNLMLWIAFIVGVALQIAVIEIPGVNTFFTVYSLSDNPIDWLWVLLCSIMPLVAHEFVVLFLFLKKKARAKKTKVVA